MRKGLKISLFFAFSALFVAVYVDAFNPDRMIYKWSPLWFNNYMRRGAILHKRHQEDEPMSKWNPPSFVDSPHNYKRSDCARENYPCSFIDGISGELTEIRCCGPMKCLPSGDQYSCLYPGYRSLPNDDLDYFYP